MSELKDNKVFEVTFENLSYKFEKEPLLRQPKKWKLIVYDKKKKIFQIDTDQDGFSQETLEQMEKQLNKINIVVQKDFMI